MIQKAPSLEQVVNGGQPLTQIGPYDARLPVQSVVGHRVRAKLLWHAVAHVVNYVDEDLPHLIREDVRHVRVSAEGRGHVQPWKHNERQGLASRASGATVRVRRSRRRA